MNKEKLKNEIIKIFWVFIIGSIVGYAFETILVILQKGHFEIRQGLLYGPLIPVYGIGAIIYYITFKLVKTRNKLHVFLIALVLGGITEYISSLVQEVAFGTISWDYSYLPFNLHGRTSLLHCTYWGIAGLLYINYVEPLTIGIENVMQDMSMKIITILLAVFLMFDIIISCMAATRQKFRMQGIEPQNSIDRFLDKYYPDEFIDKIYSNKKYVAND